MYLKLLDKIIDFSTNSVTLASANYQKSEFNHPCNAVIYTARQSEECIPNIHGLLENQLGLLEQKRFKVSR